MIAITGSNDAPTLNGSGKAIEYAIKLRRFSRDNELEQLLASNSTLSGCAEARGAALPRIA